MKKRMTIIIMTAASLCLVSAYMLKYFGCISYYAPARENLTEVPMAVHHDDTLRVSIIGDSWAAFHQHEHDCRLLALLGAAVERPVALKNGGVSGLTSKQIYQGLFQDSPVRGSITWGPNVCVVFAGVNDADRKLGTYYYQENMRLIIEFLLQHRILPIIIEIPTFNTMRSFRVRKPAEKAKYVASMLMNFSGIDCVDSYRHAFVQLMMREQWQKQIVYIRNDSWNPDGYEDGRDIYDDLQMHLNARGYQLLDECLADAISSYLSGGLWEFGLVVDVDFQSIYQLSKHQQIEWYGGKYKSVPHVLASKQDDKHVTPA